MSDAAGPEKESRWVVLQNKGFPHFIASILLNGMAVQAQTVAVGYQVWEMTRDPWDLALVGLSQFLPALCLFLLTGLVADRYSRRVIMSLVLFAQAVVAAGLLWIAFTGSGNVYLVFGLIIVFGAARAFYNPARNALVPNIVIPEHLPRAVALNSGVMEMAKICGPVMGGLLYAVSPIIAYGSVLAMLVVGGALVLMIPKLPRRVSKKPPDWEAITGGLRFIWQHPIVLGAISLDLFAVLLGGAYGMLPVYADAVLDIGATGAGFLRSAPAVGAILVAFVLVMRPVSRNVGTVLFLSVAAYGFATLVFALSTIVWLSIAALMLVGAFDVVSVQIRQSLIALNTPDELRGRVNAVNQVFVGASNELGTFRAGAMAAVIGPVAAVAAGAAATVGVAALWSWLFPTLRRVDYIS